LGTSSKRTIILLYVVHDCPGCRTAAIARHMSFSQITCIFRSLFFLVLPSLFIFFVFLSFFFPVGLDQNRQRRVTGYFNVQCLLLFWCIL